jgi:hypothetical protein
MVKVLACIVVALGALAGCSAFPQKQISPTPCSKDPGSYDCQVERYLRAPG